MRVVLKYEKFETCQPSSTILLAKMLNCQGPRRILCILNLVALESCDVKCVTNNIILLVLLLSLSLFCQLLYMVIGPTVPNNGHDMSIVVSYITTMDSNLMRVPGLT